MVVHINRHTLKIGSHGAISYNCMRIYNDLKIKILKIYRIGNVLHR